MGKPFEGPKCLIKTVRFYQEYRNYDKHTGRWHLKGATVAIEWWDTHKQMYFPKSLQVSRAKGIEFQRQQLNAQFRER